MYIININQSIAMPDRLQLINAKHIRVKNRNRKYKIPIKTQHSVFSDSYGHGH